MKYLFVTLAVAITYCNGNTVQAAHQAPSACQSTGFYLIESDQHQTKRIVGKTVISPTDVENIELSDTGDILFTLKEASGKKLHEFTKSHLMGIIGIVIDGKVMQSSHIHAPFGRKFMIGASLSNEEIYNRFKALQIPCAEPKNEP